MKKAWLFIIVVFLATGGCKKNPEGPSDDQLLNTVEEKAWSLITLKSIPIDKVEATFYAEITEGNIPSLAEELKSASVILYSPPNSEFLMTFNVLEAQEEGWIDFANELNLMDEILACGQSVYQIRWFDGDQVKFESLAVLGPADTLIFDSMMSYPIIDGEMNAYF